MTYRSAISRTSHRTQPRGEGFASAPFATSDLVLRFFRVSQSAPGRRWAPVQWSCMIFRNRWLLSAIPQEFCRNVRIPRRKKGKQGKFSCLPSTVLKDLEVALLRDPKLSYEPRRLAHMLRVGGRSTARYRIREMRCELVTPRSSSWCACLSQVLCGQDLGFRRVQHTHGS